MRLNVRRSKVVHLLLLTLLLLLLIGCCCCYVVDTRVQLSPNCLDSGLNILKKKDVKRIKATFDLKAKLVYYRVIFCQRTWICFATSIDGNVDNVENNIVGHEELWTKLVSTILGYSQLEQYTRTKHALKYGNENDHFYCHGNYYIITSKPSRLAIKNVSKAREAASRTSCLNSKSCSRTCLRAENQSYKCQEIRLQCSFDKCAKQQQQRRKQQHKQQRQHKQQQQQHKQRQSSSTNPEDVADNLTTIKKKT